MCVKLFFFCNTVVDLGYGLATVVNLVLNLLRKYGEVFLSFEVAHGWTNFDTL